VQHHKKNTLLLRFQEDHALLGAGFHQLSQCLRGQDVDGARAIARRLDESAGAHIAFEEEEFYPCLVPLVGAEEVRRMCGTHRSGLRVIRTLGASDRGEPLDQETCTRLLRRSEQMEDHIADCGELFATMGRIPVEQQQDLHDRLLQWRQRRPKWTDYAEMKRNARSKVRHARYGHQGKRSAGFQDG
jgi:hypothetical protein